MSTFVVRFMADLMEKFRGRVREVRTGEETSFSSVSELLAFFEETSAANNPRPAGDRIDRKSRRRKSTGRASDRTARKT